MFLTIWFASRETKNAVNVATSNQIELFARQEKWTIFSMKIGPNPPWIPLEFHVKMLVVINSC